MNNCKKCDIQLPVLDLGCFSSCGDMELPIVASKSGIHTFYFEYKGIQNVFQRYEKAGTRISIQNYLPEGVDKIILKITDPDGKVYTYKHYDRGRAICTDYSVFSICSKITNVVEELCNNVCCEPDLTFCENDPI